MGVNVAFKPEGDYINACYINSPFSRDDKSLKGDKRIIAA